MLTPPLGNGRECCRVCGRPLRFVKVIRGEETGAATPLFTCRSCRSFYSRLDYHNQTQRDIHTGSIDGYLLNEAYVRRRVRDILGYAFSKQWISDGRNRLLDIGCGVGWSLVVAKEMGLQATGVEPMTEAATYGTATLKLDVINALFTPDLFPPASFDFIIMDQVLEHVPNPFAMLRDTFGLLKPNGVMLLAVPPIDWSRRLASASFQLPIAAVEAISRRRPLGKFAELVKKHDTFQFPEGHISYFSTKAIAVLAANCHARVLEQYHAQRLRARCWPLLRLSTGSFFIRKDEGGR